MPIKITTYEGPNFEDFIAVAPVDFVDEEDDLVCLELARDALLECKGARLVGFHPDSAGVETHTMVAIPSRLFAPRAMKAAVKAAVAALREDFPAHVEIEVKDGGRLGGQDRERGR